MSNVVPRSGRNACGAGSSFPRSSLPSPGSTPAPACVWTLCWPVSWFPLQPDRAGSVVVPVPTSQSAEGRRGVTTSRDNNNNIIIVVTGPSWHSSYLKQDSEKELQRGSIRQSDWWCPAPAISDRAEKPSTKKSILITFSWVKLNESLVPNIHSVKILSWWHWKPQWTASCCGAATGQQPSRYKVSEIRKVHHKQQSDQRR